MLLILTIIPLALGLMIVIMALLKKLRPQPAVTENSPTHGRERQRGSASVETRRTTVAADEAGEKEEKEEVFR